MPSTFHAGFLGSAALGTQELPILRWEVHPTAKLEEFRNSKSGGYVIREPSFKDCSVAMDIDYDFANAPFGLATPLTVGSVITNARFFLHQSASGSLDGPCWNFTSLVVDSTPQTLSVDGKIVTRVTAKGSGSFVYPS